MGSTPSGRTNLVVPAEYQRLLQMGEGKRPVMVFENFHDLLLPECAIRLNRDFKLVAGFLDNPPVGRNINGLHFRAVRIRMRLVVVMVSSASVL